MLRLASLWVPTLPKSQASEAEGFARQHGVKAFVFNSYDYPGTVIDSAPNYGIKNTTGSCPHYDAPDISTDYARLGLLANSGIFLV